MATKIQACKDFSQGDGFNIHVTHNPVVDLTGYSFRLVLKYAEDSPDAVLDVTYAVPATEPEASQAALGEVYIPIPVTATANITPGKYWASLKRIDTTGTPLTLIRTGNNNAGMVEVFKNLG